MPHSTWAAVADGFPEIMVSPQAAARAAFSWVMVMIFGVGLPRAWCFTGTSWKKASSVPEVNHSRSMPFSFIDAINASAACSAGIEYIASTGLRYGSGERCAPPAASRCSARTSLRTSSRGDPPLEDALRARPRTCSRPYVVGDAWWDGGCGTHDRPICAKHDCPMAQNVGLYASPWPSRAARPQAGGGGGK